MPHPFLGPSGLLRSTVRNLRHPDRAKRVKAWLREWAFADHARLPSRYLREVLPAAAAEPTSVRAACAHPYELPYGERLVLAALCRALAPPLIVEFGTFAGSTTLLLAESAPGASVHSWDLPAPQLPFAWMADAIGRELHAAPPEVKGRITLHRESTGALDAARWAGQVGLVFVDASHEAPDVLHDSELALRLLRGPGAIVWDDYQAKTPGVVEVLNALGRHVPLTHIRGTRLVVHLRGADAE